MLPSLLPSISPLFSSLPPIHQMLDWEQDLLQRELRLAEREAHLRGIASAPGTVYPSDPGPAAALPTSPRVGESAGPSTAPAAIDADRGGGDGGGNTGGGGEATLDMPSVIEVFEAERQALIQAFSGCLLPSLPIHTSLILISHDKPAIPDTETSLLFPALMRERY
jgi:hypothetical protein